MIGPASELRKRLLEALDHIYAEQVASRQRDGQVVDRLQQLELALQRVRRS